MDFHKKELIGRYKLIDLIELGLRLWMGYTLISNSGVGIITPLEDLGMPDNIYRMIKAMWDTGYMMHAVKLIELIGGLMLVFNFFTPLALILLGPVVFNIYGMHIFVFNRFISTGLYMSLILAFLGYRHREVFLPILKKR